MSVSHFVFKMKGPEHLPKGFNPRHCAPEWDELKLRTWTDANPAILYAPCYGNSRDLKTAFLFTLKFDDAGNWKMIKTHQMSKKDRRGTMKTFFKYAGILTKGEHRD